MPQEETCSDRSWDNPIKVNALPFDWNVFDYPSLDKFPEIGLEKTAYIDTESNIIYRWDSESKEYIIIGGGGSTPSGMLVGVLTNGDSFPTTRPNGDPLENEDYIRVKASSTFPFTIGDVTFKTPVDLAVYFNGAWSLEPGAIQDTKETPLHNKTQESISGEAENQYEVNVETKKQFAHGNNLPSGEYEDQWFTLDADVEQAGGIVRKGLYRFNGSEWELIANASFGNSVFFNTTDNTYEDVVEAWKANKMIFVFGSNRVHVLSQVHDLSTSTKENIIFMFSNYTAQSGKSDNTRTTGYNQELNISTNNKNWTISSVRYVYEGTATICVGYYNEANDKFYKNYVAPDTYSDEYSATSTDLYIDITDLDDKKTYVCNPSAPAGTKKYSLVGGGGKSDFTSLRRLGDYLFEVTFENIPEYKPLSDFVPGGCSAFVRDGKLYRSYDWNYDNTAEFLVKTKNFEGMSMIIGMEDGELDFKKVAQTPYHMVDGINTSGIKVSTHILYNDFGYAGSGDKSRSITQLPYYILENVTDINNLSTDLADYFANMGIPDALAAMEYLLQILVTDGTDTYIITPPEIAGETYAVVNANANPKLTNFRWVADATLVRDNLQLRPTGVERWNEINSTTTLSDLRFTKAYEAPTRLSEFIGIDDTTKDTPDSELEAIYDIAHGKYLTRTRDGELWQSVHAIVYGDNKIEHLFVQEDYEKDYAGAGVSSWEEVENKPFETLSEDFDVEDGELKITYSTSRYTETITGDGTTTDFTITHNIGDIDAVVIVKDSNDKDIIVDITRNSSDVYTIGFGTAPIADEEYTVTIQSTIGQKGERGKDGGQYPIVLDVDWNSEIRAGSVEPNFTLPAVPTTESGEIRYTFTATATRKATFKAPAGKILTDEKGFAGLSAGNTLAYTDLTAGSIYECSFTVIDDTHIGLIKKEWKVI